MKFQWKYGFYFLYAIMIIIYLVIFSFFRGEVKNTIVSVCVYSDPAAMGMFFMGALILLEKSQRITNSIAISPVTVEEFYCDIPSHCMGIHIRKIHIHRNHFRNHWNDFIATGSYPKHITVSDWHFCRLCDFQLMRNHGWCKN